MTWPLRCSRRGRFRSVAAFVLFSGLCTLSAPRSEANVHRLAVFDFEMIDTSLAPARPDEERRLRLIDDELRSLLRRLGADEVMTGTVQKVSNPILNIDLYARVVLSGERLSVASIDIRGNADEMWLHGVRHLVRRRVLGFGED
jgi:hypothetical protein